MKAFAILALLLLFSTALVRGTCHCLIICENCYRTGDFRRELGREQCNDFESQSECVQANWEVLNKRDTTVTLVERIMDDALDKGNLTGYQVGYIRSLLALAVEDNRPEGDCANGLSTDTGVQGTLTHCFSPELLLQCSKVRDGVDAYLDGIVPRLRELVQSSRDTYRDDGTTFFDAAIELRLLSVTTENSSRNEPEMHDTLKEIVEVMRIYTRVKTAKVRCASFEATTLEIDGAVSTDASIVTCFLAMVATTMAAILF